MLSLLPRARRRATEPRSTGRSGVALVAAGAILLTSLAATATVALPAAAADAPQCRPADVWVNDIDTLRQYTPDGVQVGDDVPLDAMYGDIAWTADGTELWAVTFATSTPALVRLDPETGAELEQRPLAFPDPVRDDWAGDDVGAAANGLSAFVDPVRGPGFLLGSFLSTRVFFISETGPADAVTWSAWPEAGSTRLVSGGDFITLDDGTVLGLAADSTVEPDDMPTALTPLVRFAPDGSSPVTVGMVPLGFGAAKSGSDVYVAAASGGIVFKFAQSDLPQTPSTAAVPIEIVVADPTVDWWGATSRQDGGRCDGPLSYEVSKDASPASGSEVQVGEDVTYTITVRNTGDQSYTDAAPASFSDDLSGVLDRSALIGAPVASSGAATLTGSTLSWSGALPLDGSATVSYTVRVVDAPGSPAGTLHNTVAPTAPTGTCLPGLCETDHTVPATPLGELAAWKTVSPASGTTLHAGDVATYTLHFENSGDAPVAVDSEDVLTRVLDDADVTAQPTASSSALSVGPITAGRFSVTGTLAPGEQATVTYQVTVKADGSRGDDLLTNALVSAGAVPPETCTPTGEERQTCTSNPVSSTTPTPVASASATPTPAGLAATGGTVSTSVVAVGLGLVLAGAAMILSRRRAAGQTTVED